MSLLLVPGPTCLSALSLSLALALACTPTPLASQPQSDPEPFVLDPSLLGPSTLPGVAAWQDTERPVASDERPWDYTYEQLRAGELQHVLHGSGPLWNPQEHDAYRAGFSQAAPYLIRFGISLVPSPRHGINELVRGVRSTLLSYPRQIPLLTIKFDKNDNRTGLGQGLCREVLDGQMDGALGMLAKVLADDGRPVFVRIGPECNGFWNGYDPELFPAAFRHIAGLLRREGVPLITVWNVKLVQEMELSEMAWYPGDEAVDWWSIDLFTDDFRQPRTRQRVDDFLDEARRRGKPVMIPESCPNGLDLDSARTWSRWFAPYFDLIERDGNIKAFCYSNRDFSAHDVKLKDWGDMRIERSALAERYRQQLARPLYLHQVGPVDAAPASQPGAPAEDGPQDPRRQSDAERRRRAQEKQAAGVK